MFKLKTIKWNMPFFVGQIGDEKNATKIVWLLKNNSLCSRDIDVGKLDPTSGQWDFDVKLQGLFI
jgi:hypothetical protein